jgi:hypothetical protein
MPDKRLLDSAMFWVAVAGVFGALAAIPFVLGIEQAKERQQELLSNGLVWLGIALGLIGALALWWAVTLHVAQGHVSRRGAVSPPESNDRPSKKARKENEELRQSIVGVIGWLHDRDRGDDDLYNRSRVSWHEYAKRRLDALGIHMSAIPSKSAVPEPRLPSERIPEQTSQGTVEIIGGGIDLADYDSTEATYALRPYVDVQNFSSAVMDVQMTRLSKVVGDGIVSGLAASDPQSVPPNGRIRLWSEAILGVPLTTAILQDLDFDFRYGPTGGPFLWRTFGRCRVTSQGPITNPYQRANSLQFVGERRHQPVG